MVGEVVIPAPDLTPYATQTWVESKNYLETAPVSSVNGETGAVVLSAADIGALPADTVIPTKTSELTNDSNYVSASTLTASLATKQDALTAGSNIKIENNVISATGGGSGFSGDYNDLTNKPDLSVYAESADLATVATSGSYNDLTDKPTISTVPTNVSDFTNDAGYITSSDLPADELPAITTGDAGKVLTVNSGENGVEWTTPSGGSATVVGYEADGNTEIRIGSGNTQTKSGYIIGFNNSVNSTGDVPVVLGRDNNLIGGAGAAYTLGNGNIISASSTVVGRKLSVPYNYYGEGTIVGKYNDSTGLANQSYPFVVGTGTSSNNLKNGLILDDDANLTILGKMTVGTAPVNDMDVATKKYVDDNAGGGGATYTAGNGIEIDANNEIKTVNSNPLIHSMLQMTTAGVNNMPNVVSLGASST